MSNAMQALKKLVALHDDDVFLCGADDEKKVEKTLNQARKAIIDHENRNKEAFDAVLAGVRKDSEGYDFMYNQNQ